MNTRQLERDLLIELEGTIEAARQRNYVPTYFLRMLAEHGAAATVRKLLEKSEPQEGLFRLYELDLLDESMEAIVIKQKYQTLFTAEELEVATKRLDELGYFKGRT